MRYTVIIGIIILNSVFFVLRLGCVSILNSGIVPYIFRNVVHHSVINVLRFFSGCHVLYWLLGKTKSHPRLWTAEVKLWLYLQMGPWWGEKQQQHKVRNYCVPMDTGGETQESKRGEQNVEKSWFLFGRSRVETGERRVASPEQMFDLQESWDSQMENLPDPCRGFTGNMPPSCLEFDPPLPCYQLGLRWMKTTLVRKAILVKISYHTFS